MARRDAVARELRARRGHVHVTFSVQLVAVVVPRRKESEILELARERSRYPGTLAELCQVDVVLGARDAGPRPPLDALRGARRGQLLANDSQRQKFVPLQPQDRLEALDVILAEEPVAPLGPARREQPLILEVANLRDRDVRKFLLQAPRDGADRQQPLRSGGLGLRAHLLMKLSRYLPICTSSPLWSRAGESIRLRLTKVPLRLPRSSIRNSPSD